MRNNTITRGKGLLVALAMSLAASPHLAESELEKQVEAKPKLSAGADLSFATKYMLKGFTLSETPVFQPLLYVKYGPFTGAAFFNYDIKTATLNEADAFFDVTLPLKSISDKIVFSAGYNILTFPNTDLHTTHEVYGGLSYDMFGKPSIKVIRDISQGSGFYTELSVKHDIPLTKSTTLTANALVAHNHHLFREGSCFSHAAVGIAAPISLSKGFTFTPSINYQHSLNKDFQNEVWGGVTFSYTH